MLRLPVYLNSDTGNRTSIGYTDFHDPSNAGERCARNDDTTWTQAAVRPLNSRSPFAALEGRGSPKTPVRQNSCSRTGVSPKAGGNTGYSATAWASLTVSGAHARSME